MENKKLKKIIAIVVVILFITMIISKSFATVTPGDITGQISEEEKLDVGFIYTFTKFLQTSGNFLAIAVMMVIGIKYITGSIEEKATYKKTMVPYLIGCVLIFAGSNIVPGIMETLKETSESSNIKDSIIKLIQKVGTFISVGALMILGIKYMAGSLEEKAEYKKTMLPYLIGCLLLFGAANIAPQIEKVLQNTTKTEELGNSILGLIQVIGTFASVGILMVLGIKYMVGSVEEKASYKKTMLPYLVGAIILFSAVNLTAVIYDLANPPKEPPTGGGSGSGITVSPY